MRRPRGPGGRFLTNSALQNYNNNNVNHFAPYNVPPAPPTPQYETNWGSPLNAVMMNDVNTMNMNMNMMNMHAINAPYNLSIDTTTADVGITDDYCSSPSTSSTLSSPISPSSFPPTANTKIDDEPIYTQEPLPLYLPLISYGVPTATPTPTASFSNSPYINAGFDNTFINNAAAVWNSIPPAF